MLDINNFFDKIRPSDLDLAALTAGRQLLLPQKGTELVTELSESRTVQDVLDATAKAIVIGQDPGTVIAQAFIHGLNTGIILANKVAGAEFGGPFPEDAAELDPDLFDRALRIGTTLAVNKAYAAMISVSDLPGVTAEELGIPTYAAQSLIASGFMAGLTLNRGVEFYPEVEIEHQEGESSGSGASSAAGGF